MKKLLVGILALLFSFAVFAGTTDLDRLLLHERYGEDPWLGFATFTGTTATFAFEFDDADADAVCLFLDFPAGDDDVNVPVLLAAISSSDYGYFTGVVEPTVAVENAAGTSWLAIDHTATTLARLYAGGAATFLTIATALAGSDIVLDAADAAVNTGQQYVSITGSTPIHTTGTITDVWLDITPTIGAATGTTVNQHLIDLTFAAPIWTAGTHNLRAIYIAPTIGASTAGTNSINLIEIANYTGDAQVNVTGLKIGTSDGLGTANAIEVGTGWDYGIECESKSRFGLAQGATGINMDGTDPDQAFQVHADITSDVADGAYAAIYETMTLNSATTNDASVFGDWAELYVTGDITLAKGNLAGSWGHLELVDGGGGNLTLNAVSGVYPNWAGGLVGTVIAPDTLIIGAHRSVAAVVASGAIASGYSVNADGDFAGVLIRADDQPFPVGLLIDDDDATIDIQLSNDQLIDGDVLGDIVADKCTAVEYAAAAQKTVLTFTLTGDHDLDLADGDHGTGIKVYDFPGGRILILGATIDASVTTSANYEASPNDVFVVACGTEVGADDNTLTGTEADLIPSTELDTVGATELTLDWHAALAASAHFDGTGTPKDLYVNVACTAASASGANTYAITGTMTISWVNLGNY